MTALAAFSFLLFMALIAAAMVLMAALAARMKRRRHAEDRLRGATFRAEPLLVNESERAAFRFLHAADLGQTHVFPKVRLEDVVSASSASARVTFAARVQIKSRHLDFLLTNADFRPILAVEVDGGWHARARAAVGDEVKNTVLAAAGVPLLRLRVGSDWNTTLGEWKRQRGLPATAEAKRVAHSGGPSRP